MCGRWRDSPLTRDSAITLWSLEPPRYWRSLFGAAGAASSESQRLAILLKKRIYSSFLPQCAVQAKSAIEPGSQRVFGRQQRQRADACDPVKRAERDVIGVIRRGAAKVRKFRKMRAQRCQRRAQRRQMRRPVRGE